MSDTTVGIQMRGKCCFCGKEHATKNGLMVNHGYTVDWGMFNGECHGTHKVHYGHVGAPDTIRAYIVRLNETLEELPSLIEHQEALLVERVALLDGYNRFSSERKRAREAISSLRSTISGNKHALNGGIEAMIEGFNKSIKNWIERPLREVNIEVEMADIRKSRQAEAATKQAEREAVKAAKKTAQLEREAKADEKAKAAWEALKGNNYYRLFYRGELLESWEASIESEREIYDKYHDLGGKHWGGVSDDLFGAHAHGNYYLDVRSKPEGKGKKLFDINSYSSAKSYFQVWD